MKISPRELREAQIPSKAFGFNQDVVDALLERAADTIEGLIEENRQLFEALERLRSEGSTEPSSDPFEGVKSAPEPEPQVVPEAAPVVQETVAPAASIDESLLLAQVSEKEDLINKTLLLAQKTADETLKTAKEQAEKLVATAQTNADELIAAATANAESVTGTASEQAEKELAQAQEQAQAMVAAAQGQADELVSVAQAQADSIHAQEREKFETLVAKLSQERAQLLSDIEILQSFDEKHRSKLREIVEQDLETLVARPSIDVGSIPELPVVEPEAAKPKENDEKAQKVVAHSEMPAEDSFDEIVDSAPVVEPASYDDIDDIDDEALFSEEIEVEVIESKESSSESVKAPDYDSGDPFAAFVDAPSVVSPAGAEDEDDGRVAESPSGQVESSGSTTAFDPGAKSKSKHQDPLDDDDFFASLREAVADDAPLGPSDDEGDQGGKFKGLFKK